MIAARWPYSAERRGLLRRAVLDIVPAGEVAGRARRAHAGQAVADADLTVAAAGVGELGEAAAFLGDREGRPRRGTGLVARRSGLTRRAAPALREAARRQAHAGRPSRDRL